MIQCLRVAGEAEGVSLRRRKQIDDIGQVRIHQVRAGEHDPVRRRRPSFDRAHHVDVAVVEWERVVVADRNDPLVRLRSLARLDVVREEFRLRATLHPDARAIVTVDTSQ